MSARDYASQVVVAYKDAEGAFHEWRKQRSETIQKIRDIANDIQQLETMHRKGHVAYSSVGLVAGAMTIAGILGAPFTLGGSLGLTAAGAATGLASGAASITHTWMNSSKIKSKCDEAADLLKQGEVLTQSLLEKLQHFQVLQSRLCDAVGVRNLTQMTMGTLGSIVGVGGELVALLTANIPNMAQSSKALSFMFGFGGMNFGVSFTAQNVGRSLAPAIGRQTASSVAKSSLRVIGTAAVGVGVVMDVLNIVNNKQALDANKLCDQTRALKDTADAMEEEMFRFDSVFYLDKMSELDSMVPLDKKKDI